MYTYYTVQGTVEGKIGTLYGSYLRGHCVDEMEYERDSWKSEGYRSIKIIKEQTKERPSPNVYSNTELLSIITRSK